METKHLYSTNVLLGCDPEFFFIQKGKVIGSEKIIDIENGLQVTELKTKMGSTQREKPSRFIVDGVQAEINPRPDNCRARLGNELSMCFKELDKKLKRNPSISVTFDQTVKVSKAELKSLSPKSRTFGCSPSLNVDIKNMGYIAVDPAKYFYRSAGGHIHLGRYQGNDRAFENHERLVNILDIIVGNTCVMLDRDKGNKERRKVYGRAGEYRLPPHGLEYRTLSNFWLRAYPLYSFVMGLARLAVSISYQSDKTRNFGDELLALVDIEDIRKAINTNNIILAKRNFNKIKKWIANNSIAYVDHPLTVQRIKAFEYVAKKGINHYFKEDPVQHWATLREGHGIGWESFLANTVMPEMQKK